MLPFLLVVVLAVAGYGCSSQLGKPIGDTGGFNKKVESQQQAASVHVAVVAAARWEDTKATFVTKFPIDEKDALAQSVPTTISMVDKVLSVFQGQLSLSPSSTLNSFAEKTTKKPGEADVTESTTTVERKPGTTGTATVGSALGSSKSTELPTAQEATGTDRFLQYRAAAGLLHEIRALNLEVDNAARRNGLDAYLLRIQVAVMPFQRGLGYDAYANISVFAEKGDADKDSGKLSMVGPTDGVPFIVPLLGTENIEAAGRMRGQEAIRDLSIALNLVKGFGAVGFSARSGDDRYAGTSGKDINALMTVGRLSDNTLRVRFGANYDPEGGFSLLPRTHYVTLLVFVPRKATQLRLLTRTALFDIDTGKPLPARKYGWEEYEARLAVIAEKYENLGLTVDTLKNYLDDMALHGDYERFSGKMDASLKSACRPDSERSGRIQRLEYRKLKNAGVCRSDNSHRLSDAEASAERHRSFQYVWSDLLALLPGTRFSHTLVDLPVLKDAECPDERQLVAYSSNDEGVRVTLGAGKYLRARDIVAKLFVAPKATAGGAETAEAKALYATSISVTTDGSVTSLLFPPISTMSANTTDAPYEAKRVELACARRIGEGEGGRDFKAYELHARLKEPVKADKDKDPPALFLSSRVVATDPSRTGVVTVALSRGSFESNGKALLLGIKGADIDSWDPSARIERTKDKWVVTSSGHVKLALRNLVPNQTVDMELFASEAGKVTPLGVKESIGVQEVVPKATK